MRNIILIGMPGSGKTTFGKAIAERLGRPFIDADDYLEEKEGRTIASLFAISEDAFRDAEERTIRDLSEKENLVIATGGGVIKRRASIENLKKNGHIFFLDRDAKDIASDVEVEKRPLLKDGPQKVYDLYQERITLYRNVADTIIGNHGTEEEVLEKILAIIEGL